MTPPTRALSQTEFIALMAMLAATVAFSIDSMLPALPEIGQELTPNALNRAQLIITSFVFGMGLGTFLAGPLSDAIGRKPVMLGGAALYCAASAFAFFADSLELMLIARAIQGFGAAGPRVVALAMIRDLHSGRDMARIMSIVMVVFSLVPALAPAMGYYLIVWVGWRALFVSYIVFSAMAGIWLFLRQPETLAVAARRPLAVSKLVEATKEVFANQTTRLSIIAQTLTFGMLFATLSSIQQIFDVTFDRGHEFHLWFGGIAVLSAGSSIINARYVGRFGMRAIVRLTYQGVALAAGLLLLTVAITDNLGPQFIGFFVFILALFFATGLTIGNLNALGMEPMGHLAGFAASTIAAIATVGAVFIAAPAGLAFDGTPVPLAVTVLICAVLSYLITTKIKRPGED